MADFVHLHCHSEYSLLDGLCRLQPLVEQVKALGMPAVALTDHGVMFGAVEFYRAAREAGVTPILGCELYIARRDMRDKDPEADKKSHHLIVLAENETGYRNLLQIASAAQLEGFYYKPRVDHAFLESHAEGLIALSACKSGEVVRAVEGGRAEEARRLAAWHRDVFGPRNYFIELQHRTGLPEMAGINRELLAVARELDVPVVATNDVHYIAPGDAATQELLLAIQTQTTWDDPRRMRMEGGDYYLRSPEEMARLFDGLPQALANSMGIAERCNLNLDPKGYHLPAFDVPAGTASETYLRLLAENGLAQRYGLVTPALRERLDYELSVIHTMGFDDYFLIVWDLTQYARQRGIWFNIRGSAAASIAAYALGVTALDPIAHSLIFDRFLNPARVSMPDIDMDFPDDRRGELIDYAVRKYGRDRVAQIITFGTLGAKAAIRDVGRVLGRDPMEVDRVARLVPFGPKVHLADCLAAGELAALYRQDASVHDLVDKALSLEGVSRHASTHAAGVVIGDRPLIEYVPLHRPTKEKESRGKDGEADGALGVVTQYAMEDLEYIGLLKMDFLGLATLTIMKRAVDLIAQTRGERIDIEQVPLDDPAIYTLLSSGNVEGIFQVEGSGMRRVLTGLQPSTFADVSATIALFRPGPMQFIDSFIARKHGREPIAYRHPALEPILKETYGALVFQEQVIQVMTDLAGYSAADADLVRRAVGKKKAEELKKHREDFIQGAVRTRNLQRETAEQIFADIEYFANYGFNKAHSADYALITCQTAWLKAHYPAEYMTALLSVSRGNTEKIATYVAECTRLNIEVLPPDINQSELDFTVERVERGERRVVSGESEFAIRFALGAVKNVGDGVVEAVVGERRANGPFRSLDEFCERVDLRLVNKRALECLIRCGALEPFGRREPLLAVLDRMMEASQRSHQAQSVGQLDMFGGALGGLSFSPLPDVESKPLKEVLGWEKELLGIYVSEHPLKRVMPYVEQHATATIGQIDPSLNGQMVIVAGLVTGVRTITTRQNKPMAFVQLEDLHGSIEVTVFPRLYERSAELWVLDTAIVLRAKAEERDGKMQLLAESVEPLAAGNVPREAAEGQGAEPVSHQPDGRRHAAEGWRAEGRTEQAPRYHLYITVPRTGDTERDVQRIGEVYALLQQHPGEDRFSLYTHNSLGKVLLDFPNATTRHSVQLQQKLVQLLGAGTVSIRTAEP